MTAYRLRYSEVDSTQKVAISLAKEGAKHGVAVIARAQTSGKGRNGRSWESPEGGLYESVIVQPDPLGLHLLSLATGLEVLGEISRFSGSDLKLKWPNDIVVEDIDGNYLKVCGILTDVVNPEGLLPVAIIGVGLNMRRTLLGDDVAPKATFMEDLASRSVSVEELEEPVIGAVLRAAQRVSSQEERASMATEFNRVLWGVGRAVTIDGVKGILTGVGASGEALLSTESGAESFWSGDILPLQR